MGCGGRAGRVVNFFVAGIPSRTCMVFFDLLWYLLQNSVCSLVCFAVGKLDAVLSADVGLLARCVCGVCLWADARGIAYFFRFRFCHILCSRNQSLCSMYLYSFSRSAVAWGFMPS